MTHKTRPLSPLSMIRLAAIFACREMRAGVQGFAIFLACLALGVAAIAGVNTLSSSLTESIALEGRNILGGDIRFSLVHREVNTQEAVFLKSLGAVSTSAQMRAMARLEDGHDQSLVELKAVDNAYPLYGNLTLEGTDDFQTILSRRQGAHYSAIADQDLMHRLKLKLGDTIQLGKAHLVLSAIIDKEPDRLSGTVEFGPRLMISLDTMRATGLIQTGSLIRWAYHVKGEQTISKRNIETLRARALKEFPNAGWQITGHDNASPGLARNIERFAQFLTLVSLTALIVGGLGIANAVSAYLLTKRDVIATLKSIGASGQFVFMVYMIQIMIVTTIAVLAGLAFGAMITPVAALFLETVLPVTIKINIEPATLGLAALYGYLMAIAFALWPLARARDIAPAALFRNSDSAQKILPRPIYLVALLLIVLLLIALAIGLSDNRRIATYFIAGTLISFIILRFIAFFVMILARSLPDPRSTEWRMALGNIYRKGAITPPVVLSLGLGLTLLVSISLIDHNLRHQLTSSIADKAPSFFFVDLQNHEIDAFERLIHQKVPTATLERVPMMRGFFVEIAGKKPEDMLVPSESQWALRGDRGITYAANLPRNTTLQEGAWWPKDYQGPPLVSFEAEVAQHFGLAIGDKIKINVLGREIVATLANTRKVEWESLGINFLMVFSPDTFAGAPHSNLATLTYQDSTAAEQEFALMRAVSTAFPTITVVRVKEALARVASVIGQLAWAIRGASALTLLASLLVLAGALAAGQRTRISEAIILKTLGATRHQLVKIYLIQFIILGFITSLFGVLSGTLAAWFVVETIMEGNFTFQPLVAFSATLLALSLCILSGLAETWRILGQKAAPLLRNQ